jgi:K+-transporting ATPase KdpF subunit
MLFGGIMKPEKITGGSVMVDMIIAGTIAAALFGYLAYALMKPEDF